MIQLVLGAICIGFAPIFVKLVHLPPTPIGIYRCGIAAVILFFMVKWKNYPVHIWKTLVIGGALFAVDLFVWHRSVLYAGAGIGTILGNTQVFYVALYGMVFHKEKISVRFFLALLLAFLGIYLLTNKPETNLGNDHYTIGVVYGLLTGIVYASYILTMRRLELVRRSIPTIDALAYVSFFSTLFLFLISLVEGSLVLPTPMDWFWLLALAIVAQVVGWLLITRSLAKAPVSRAGLVLNLQPVISVIAGSLILGEHLSNQQLLGAFLTILSISLGSTSGIKKNRMQNK